MGLQQPLFLLGFMGCGKSTLGKKIANKCQVAFMDLDDAIEARLGQSIRQFVDSEGEAAFRAVETETLRDTGDFTGVVALGGGTPCFGDNMDWINAHGTSVYLQYPPKTLCQRLLPGRAQRPLIAHLSDAELLPFIEEKLKAREEHYQQAQHTWTFGAGQTDPISFLVALLQKNA